MYGKHPLKPLHKGLPPQRCSTSRFDARGGSTPPSRTSKKPLGGVYPPQPQLLWWDAWGGRPPAATLQ